MKINRLALFGLMALVQLSVPGWMIWSQEKIVVQGETFRFRVGPMDPNDPFRGSYLHLDFQDLEWKTRDSSFQEGEEVFVALKLDAEHFAVIDEVLHDRPKDKPYVTAELTSPWINFSQSVRVRYPFDRYYLNEYMAPDAETAYIESGRDTTLEAFVLVKVLEGNAVIEDLVIGDKSVRELVRERGE